MSQVEYIQAQILSFFKLLHLLVIKSLPPERILSTDTLVPYVFSKYIYIYIYMNININNDKQKIMNYGKIIMCHF